MALRLLLVLVFLLPLPARAAEPGTVELVRRNQDAVVEVIASQSIPKGFATRFRDFIDPFPLRSFIPDTIRLVAYVPRAIVYPFPSKQMGSGFVIDENGHTLTNLHVIEDCDKIEVRLRDHRRLDAELLGTDALADLALVKIVDAQDEALTHVTLGDSDGVEVGDPAVTIGSPFGLGWSATSGIVSGLHRTIGMRAIEDYIQTDAAVNFGNSGGPLFNAEGEVIGVNTAAMFLGQSVAFALPINTATDVLDDLKTTPGPRRGYLGVQVADLSTDLKEKFDLDLDKGAVVVSMRWYSPARKAGLRRGDVVTECEGKPITEAHELIRAIVRARAGDQLRLGIQRDRGKMELTVTLGKWPRKRSYF